MALLFQVVHVGLTLGFPVFASVVGELGLFVLVCGGCLNDDRLWVYHFESVRFLRSFLQGLVQHIRWHKTQL